MAGAVKSRANGAAPAADEIADGLAERVLALEEAVFELLRACKGIGGSGILARSPVARGIAISVYERKVAVDE